MQRILNNPDEVVDEMLQGFLKAHPDIVEATEDGRVAVSYTHLDVYKRQTVDSVVAQGIPVIALDNKINTQSLLTTIIPDNRENGRLCGEWAASKKMCIRDSQRSCRSAESWMYIRRVCTGSLRPVWQQYPFYPFR